MQSLWDKQGTFTTFQTLNRDISTEAGMQAISDYEALIDGPARKNRHP